MKEILVIINYYLPGCKAGGPVQSIANIVDLLGDQIKFKIVTLDRDFNDSAPYPGIINDTWNQVGKADVYYLSPKKATLLNLRRIIRSTKYDVMYLNSMFNPVYTITPLMLRKFSLIPYRPIILAPRGELSRGALSIKAYKKRPYNILARAFGLYNNIVWQASSELEAQEIKNVMGPRLNLRIVPITVKIAADLPAKIPQVPNVPVINNKKRGSIRIVFLSRVTPKKNLDFAIKILSNIKTPVQYDVYGIIDDDAYWKRCKIMIRQLPSNIRIKYCGHIDHSEVHNALKNYDLFFMPTKGENYGHVIFESLNAGIPVLISDQTPWQDLEQEGVGWSLPLSNIDGYMNVIEKVIGWDDSEWKATSNRAIEYANRHQNQNEVIEQNRSLFLDIV